MADKEDWFQVALIVLVVILVLIGLCVGVE